MKHRFIQSVLGCTGFALALALVPVGVLVIIGVAARILTWAKKHKQ